MASRLHSIEYREIQLSMLGQLDERREYTSDPNLDHNGKPKWYRMNYPLTHWDRVEFAARRYMQAPTEGRFRDWLRAVSECKP